MKLFVLVAGLALLLAAEPMVAHHAFAAEFDAKQPVKFKAVVTKMEWTNPHVWIYMNVVDESGKLVNWGFEMGAPHQVQNQGWTRTTLKVGDNVTAFVHPGAAGQAVGLCVKFVMADGKEVFQRGAGVD